MQLANELLMNGFELLQDLLDVFCNASEDNSGALELTHMPKMGPHTKHANICCHHFKVYEQQGKINQY